MALKVNKTANAKGYDYIIKSEIGQADPFTIKVKRANSRDIMSLNDKIIVRDENHVMYMANDFYRYNVAKLGILGWTNMNDEDGNQIKPMFEFDGTISDASMQLLTEEIIKEVADVIIRITKDPANIQVLFSDTTEQP